MHEDGPGALLLEYTVAEATPFTRTFPVTLPTGEVVTATGDGLVVQLVPAAGADHGALTLRFSAHELGDDHPFTPGAAITVTIGEAR